MMAAPPARGPAEAGHRSRIIRLSCPAGLRRLPFKPR
jgi:hypothetical protein